MNLSINAGTSSAAAAQMRLVTEELLKQRDILRQNERTQEKIQGLGVPRQRSSLGMPLSGAPSVNNGFTVTERERFRKQFNEEAERLRDRADAEQRGVGGLGRREFRRGTRLFEILQGAGGGPQGNLSLLRGLVEDGASSKLGQTLGLGKVASTMSAFSGPLMIGAMVAEQAMQIYEARLENENSQIRIMGQNIDAARELGVNGETRRRLARDVQARNDIARRTSLQNQADSMSPRAMARIFEDAYNRLTGVYEKEDEEEQKRILEALSKASKSPDALRKLIDIDEVKRRAGGDQSKINDIAFSMMIENTKKLLSVVGNEDVINKRLEEEKLHHEFRTRIDPLYAAQWRNMAQLQKEVEEEQIMAKQGWNDS